MIEPRMIGKQEILEYGCQIKANEMLCSMYEIKGFALVIQWPRWHDAIAPFMWDYIAAYPTAEHAYQAQRAGNKESAQKFEVHALFHDLKVLEKWPLVRSDGVHNVRSELCVAKEMVGVVARMVSNVSAARAKSMWNIVMGRKVPEVVPPPPHCFFHMTYIYLI